MSGVKTLKRCRSNASGSNGPPSMAFSDEQASAEDGPASLQETFEVVKQNTTCALQHSGMRKNLSSVVGPGKKIVVTNAWTGMGTDIEGAKQVCEQVCSQLAVDSFQFVVYSTCDLALVPQRTIRAHAAGPLHVFENVSHRLNRDAWGQVANIVGEACGLQKANKEEFDLGNIHRRNYLATQSRLETDMLHKVYAVLDSSEYEEKAYCLVHKTECFISPRSDPRFAEAFWIDQVGHDCTPWTRMGNRERWLHPASIPALIWAFGVRFYEPDQAMTECAPDTDYGPFQEILCKSHDGATKSAFTRNLLKDEKPGDRVYTHTLAKCSPIDFGIPSSRLRALGCFDLHPVVTRADDMPTFLDLFGRRMLVDASIYFTVSEADRREEIMTRLSHAKSAALRERNVTVETVEEIDCLTAEGLRRLEDYQVRATRMGLCSQTGAWHKHVSVAMINIRQQDGNKGKVQVNIMPSLPQCSHLYDMVAGVSLSLPESWSVQGYPHPRLDALADRTKAGFPFPSILDDASPSYATPAQQRSLLGNSMNLQQVATWFLYNLGATRKDV